jgi:hypothetical protein
VDRKPLDQIWNVHRFYEAEKMKKIYSSLKEKYELLQEIDHRENNLVVIIKGY